MVIKTPAERMQRDMIEALAPDFPYIVIINEADTVTDAIASRKVNFVGVETVFKTEAEPRRDGCVSGKRYGLVTGFCGATALFLTTNVC